MSTGKTSAPPRRRPVARRSDFGAPVEVFFARQPPLLRPVVDALAALIAEVAPEAQPTIKWGMPYYAIAGKMVCAISAHRAHVSLMLAGPPEGFPDPGGRLEGAGKAHRHLKVRALDELPREAVRRWLRVAAGLARAARPAGPTGRLSAGRRSPAARRRG